MKVWSLVLGLCLITSFAFAEADLYDGFSKTGESAIDKIAIHTFSAGLRELARGAITKSQLVNALNLNTTQQNNLDSIINIYNSKTNSEKIDFIIKFHDVAILCEAGFYSKVKAKQELGF